MYSRIIWWIICAFILVVIFFGQPILAALGHDPCANSDQAACVQNGP